MTLDEKSLNKFENIGFLFTFDLSKFEATSKLALLLVWHCQLVSTRAMSRLSTGELKYEYRELNPCHFAASRRSFSASWCHQALHHQFGVMCMFLGARNNSCSLVGCY